MQSDLFGAVEARDEALARVRANAGSSWEDQALSLLSQLCGMEGTFEDFRVRMQLKGLAPPHHHNAWGALAKEAIRRRMVVHTGRSRQTRTRNAHARVAKVYVVRWSRD